MQFILVLCFLVPSMAWSLIDVYTPQDVAHIFLDEKADGSFRIVIKLESGELYRLDPVVWFESTRYRLYEDIANIINDEPNFSDFDDEDVQELLWGIPPFTLDEIVGISTDFTEGEPNEGDSMMVILTFNTGDTAKESVSLDGVGFASAKEVTDHVTKVINDMDQFEGEIDPSRVDALHTEEYTGLDYFTPALEVNIVYDEKEENFNVQVLFAIGEERSFELPFKNTKEEIYTDTTNVINNEYVQYKEAQFSVDEIKARSTFEAPWMIDEIKEITFKPDVALDGTLQFSIRVSIGGGLVAVIDLHTAYKQSTTDLDAISLAAVEVLETNELFMPHFEQDDVKKLLIESILKEDYPIYGLEDSSDAEDPNSSAAEPVVDPVIDPAETTDPVETVISTPDNTTAIENDDSLTEDKPADLVLNKEHIKALLVALIIAYIEEKGIEVDTRSLFD